MSDSSPPPTPSNPQDSSNRSGSDSGRPPVDPRGVLSAPPPPPPPPGGGYPGYMPPAPQPVSRGKGVASRIVGGLVASLLLFSLVVNVYLFIFMVSVTAGPHEQVYQDGDAGHRIVILPITGLIDESTAVNVRQALSALAKDLPTAIVLRVDSGGGYVQPSDLIWHYLKAFKDKHQIPIVASFGQIAASGGYYVSASSDVIFAEPTTITGSIGVLSTAFTMDELLEKVGVTPEIASATQSPEKDVANNIFRPWNEADRMEQQELIDWMYERFVTVVADGRSSHLSMEELRLVADGSVYNSDQAIANKLVDKTGYITDAIDEAAALGNVPAGTTPKVTVISRPYRPGLMGLLGYHGQSSAGSSDASGLGALLTGGRIDGESVRRVMLELASPRLVYQYAGYGAGTGGGGRSGVGAGD